MAWVSQFSNTLRPSTWPPSAYLLPIGLICIYPQVTNQRQISVRRFTGYMLAITLLLYLLAYFLPKYYDTGILGIYRPTQLPLLLILGFVIRAYWGIRAQHQLFEAIALMSILLFLSDFFMLYSTSPHEKFTMMAHSGKLFAYAMMHTIQMRIAAEDSRARCTAEAELLEAKKLADLASKSKSEFLAHMSHEIRTPMNAVLGFAKLLQDEPLNGDQRQMVQRINTAGRSLLSIINDILDFSKIEAGQLSIDRQPFKMPELLGHLESLMGAVAQDKGLSLHVRQDVPIAGRLSGDALRIEQVLINLVGNALKFTERGGVTLRVSPVSVTESSAWLSFEIEDTGIGLSPEAVSKLFVPFSQADTGITRRFGGTGLGLSICKRLVELMGGKIGVNSTLGVGSTFWFELPFERLADEEKPAKSADKVKGPRLQGLRLLVVDDNPINLKLAEHVLRREGAEVTLMADGQQARDGLRANPTGFDLVLMDIHMPVMDGMAATRAIREELQLKALPIIALSAGVLAEEKQNALDAGFNNFLPKPMELDKMVEMINRHCQS